MAADQALGLNGCRRPFADTDPGRAADDQHVLVENVSKHHVSLPRHVENAAPPFLPMPFLPAD
ncbi:hypothetical protein [Streptomyces sp. NPDC051183]|uniref:hypothetical protein n=1 Tax=Streptomyces sp. NPDC051183 TaxID=3155165 RepID=UPI0034362C9A